MSTWFATTFAALRNRQFRVLWAGTGFSFVAFFMSTVVQSVVAYDLEETNSAVGVVVFAQGIAQLSLGPFGGALADRVSKRKLILACQGLIAVTFFALALLVATDVATVAYLAVGSFMIGAAFSFLGPARQGLMVEMVGPGLRGNAVALSQVALNASRILGPALATLFLAVGLLGAGGAYTLMGVLYIAAIWTTVILPDLPTNPSGRGVFTDIGLGLRYVWQHPRLRLLVLSYVTLIMCGFPYVTVLPGMVENELGMKTSTVSILFAVNAVGGLAASLGVAGLADSSRASAVYTGMSVIFGVSLVLTGISPNYAVLSLAMFVVGFGSGGFQTLNGAIISHICEPAYFGRVVSLTFLAFAAFGVIALPVGLIADAAGERATLAGMGALVLGLVAVFALLERAGAGRAPAHAPAGGGS